MRLSWQNKAFLTTIAAIATPLGSGGIGIIKISGQDAVSIARSIFQKSSSGLAQIKENKDIFESHHLYHGHIVNPVTGQMLDEVLMTVMRAPHSYAREDVVELQAHSGIVSLRAILDLILKQGIQLAEPGEFTKRAFINGRIDLTQAEAVIDLIHAKTEKSLEIAMAQIKGQIRNRVEWMRTALLHVLAQIEAGIDFPDELEEENLDTGQMLHTLQHEVIEPLKTMLSQYESRHFLKDGLHIAIIGRPNVGKSSLMNHLLQKDRAIVTSIPGTTRDSIEDILNINGIPVVITDTAGIHSTADPVEVLGIQKTDESIIHSDLILFMIDVSESFTQDDHLIYEKIHDKKFTLIANKWDLVENGFKLNIPDSWNCSDINIVKTSAIYNKGLDELKTWISDRFLQEDHTQDTIVPNLRHKLAFEKAATSVFSAIEGIKNEIPFELISIDIQESLDLLGEIIGITVKEDVLDEIFSTFCIGK